MTVPVALERCLMLFAACLALSAADRGGWLVGVLAAAARGAQRHPAAPTREARQ